MRIAIIPARGGSKRIPRKNIKNFEGKPIIAWSIEAAKKSNLFGKILVSTDDLEIAEVALSLGAEVPFIRPAELADDHTGTAPVVAHAIKYLLSDGLAVEEVCCIYATAPFISTHDLIRGLDKLRSCDAAFAFSVTPFAFPIQRALKLDSDFKIQMIDPSKFWVRSQDLEMTFHDAGQFYWGTVDAWLSNKPIFSENSVPIMIPASRSQDIDTLEDWVEAELKFRLLQINEQSSKN